MCNAGLFLPYCPRYQALELASNIRKKDPLALQILAFSYVMESTFWSPNVITITFHIPLLQLSLLVSRPPLDISLCSFFALNDTLGFESDAEPEITIGVGCF